MRDIIAYAEETNKPICLLSIDFKEAFDKISHTFLFKVLRDYGIGDNFCSRLQNIYADATSTLTLNGHKWTPIKLLSGQRQRFPLSVLLFALCINPFLINLDKMLNGLYIRYSSTKMTAIAYNDNCYGTRRDRHRRGDTTRLNARYWCTHQYKQITGYCPWILEQINARNGHYIPRRYQTCRTPSDDEHTAIRN